MRSRLLGASLILVVTSVSSSAVREPIPVLMLSNAHRSGLLAAFKTLAREVAGGRVDLRAPDHERGWRRLRAIPGIGSWTQEILAVHGQGRYDQIPAGDLGFVKLVGRLRSGGDPRERATEDEVREFFAPYEGWAGLAGAHALRSPVLAGGRCSAPARRRAA